MGNSTQSNRFPSILTNSPHSPLFSYCLYIL
nr:MAG TPA: hypothetical protein [Caudoviricetes sp.]